MIEESGSDICVNPRLSAAQALPVLPGVLPGALPGVLPGVLPGALPGARVPIAIRPGTVADLPFIDALQKRHSKALGFFPRGQLEGYLGSGGVLVAEGEPRPSGSGGSGAGEPLPHGRGSCGPRVGYIISRDRYLKRDELGVIYQLCVSPEPGMRRSLVGASLVKAAFERSAWGCRLYCCWCAQDLEANRFWEALGFVPIAFRAGSARRSPASRVQSPESGKASGEGDSGLGTRDSGRVHIFWQKRIRGGDVSTPWWFPAKTDQGAMRADRLVFPIPPGVRWSEVRAVLPGGQEDVGWGMGDVGCEEGESHAKVAKGAKSAKRVRGKRLEPEVGSVGGPIPGAGPTPPVRALRQFGGPCSSPPPAPPAPPPEVPGGHESGVPGPESGVGEGDAGLGSRPGTRDVGLGTAAAVAVVKEKRRAPRKAKCDPRLIAAARELRDRYLDEVNRLGSGYALGAVEAKYDVTRVLPAPPEGAGPMLLAEGITRAA